MASRERLLLQEYGGISPSLTMQDRDAISQVVKLLSLGRNKKTFA